MYVGSDLPHSLLPVSLRPSRLALEKYRYNVKLFLKPDLPQHGLYHAVSVMVWTNVLINIVPKKMQNKIDRKVLSYAGLYHDCGRITDWGWLQGEMQKHGPRGADLIRMNSKLVDKKLTQKEIGRIAELIQNHTPTNTERRAKRKDKRTFEEYSIEELELRLLQDADHADLVRGYYGRNLGNSTLTNVSKILAGGRSLLQRIPGAKNRMGIMHRTLRFQDTKDIYGHFDTLAKVSRHDPEINKKYPGDPFGATMEAAERLGIVKK